MPLFSTTAKSTADAVKLRLDKAGVSEQQSTTHENINSLIKLRGAKANAGNYRRGQVDVMVHGTMARGQKWTKPAEEFAT